MAQGETGGGKIGEGDMGRMWLECSISEKDKEKQNKINKQMERILPATTIEVFYIMRYCSQILTHMKTQMWNEQG